MNITTVRRYASSDPPVMTRAMSQTSLISGCSKQRRHKIKEVYCTVAATPIVTRIPGTMPNSENALRMMKSQETFFKGQWSFEHRALTREMTRWPNIYIPRIIVQPSTIHHVMSAGKSGKKRFQMQDSPSATNMCDNEWHVHSRARSGPRHHRPMTQAHYGPFLLSRNDWHLKKDVLGPASVVNQLAQGDAKSSR